MEQQYTRHYLSEIWPNMEPAVFDELTESIRKNGLRQPILVVGNEIVDGWHRYQACRIMEVLPQFEEVDEGQDLKSLVIDQNSHRRHLNENQIAAVLVLAEEWDGGKGGRPSADSETKTRAELAEKAGVSKDTITRIRKGVQAGYGEHLVSGDISPSKAERLADEETPNQPASAFTNGESPDPNKLTPVQLRLKQLAERVNELEEEKAELKGALELLDYGISDKTEQERAYAELQRKVKYETDRANGLQNELAVEKKAYSKLLHVNKQMGRELEQLKGMRVTEDG